MSEQNVIEKIYKNKIIMVIRAIPEEKLLRCVEALYDGGIRLVEVAFDGSSLTDDAQIADQIALISNGFPEICVGAGTVMTSSQVMLARNSGAKYIVSPNTNENVIQASKKNGLVSIPGALTPSEICLAKSFGADFVKVFPAGCMGPKYFSAISTPLNSVPLLAVGGIELADIPGYINSGVIGFGISTKILKPALIEANDYAAITKLAREYVDAVANGNR